MKPIFYTICTLICLIACIYFMWVDEMLQSIWFAVFSVAFRVDEVIARLNQK